ncbi:MAG TPA: phosphopantetheine-binding protein [Rugosimonospora sp.]|nr:phosphopantetheine-binding protein [Rugosimonospora sp.]
MDVRRILESAWREVLPVDTFGPDDNFFELGGGSLEAVAVIDRLNHELGTDVSGIGLFERPTISAMIDLLRPSGAGDEPLRESLRRGERRRAIELARAQPDE